jgi:superfamily II DNA or RNA helicase
MRALRPGQMVRIRSRRWRVVRNTAYADTSLVEVASLDGTVPRRAGFLLPFDQVDCLPQSDAPRVVRPARWRRHVRGRLADAEWRYDSLRTAARSDFTILPFQLEPALAVVRGRGCRLLLADEVGLGKTIQAGLIVSELLARHSDGRALIVCPSGLREQWRDELSRRFGLTAAIVDAAMLARAEREMGPAANPWSAHPVVITSIDFLKRVEVIRGIEALVWDVTVFDEAHALSGASERAVAASNVADRSRVVVLASATPHSGDPDAFARLCRTGQLRSSFPLLVFRRTRREVGGGVSRRTDRLRVRLTAAERAMHEALMDYARLVWRRQGASARLAVAVLVRRACSSAVSLERSVERRLSLLREPETAPAAAQLAFAFDNPAGMDDEPLAQLAAPGLDDRERECRQLERLGALARLAAAQESKLAALRRLISRTSESILVFTEYRDTLEHLAASLSNETSVLLHGGLTSSERREAAGRFQRGDVRLLLATDAASEGLNLHHRCRTVVNLELPWTPTRLEQRVGRVDRIGQDARVHAIHLVARDTAEEDVVMRLIARDELARAELSSPIRLHERDVTTAVFEGAVTQTAPAGATPPASPVVHDLRSDAIDEAARIATARALGSLRPQARPLRSDTAHEDDASDGRPPMTCVRRAVSPSACWAFSFEFEDADGQVVWTALCGLHAYLAPPRPRSPEVLRAALDPSRAREAAEQEHHRLAVRLRQAIEASVALATEREAAIADALRQRHARMAATLIQPGLFDRRAERAVEQQSQVLDDALARCEARQAALDRLRTATASGCHLAFALLVG